MKTKKKAWYWDDVHQTTFDLVKATISKDVDLAYPDYLKEFKIYTDALSKQLGAVITQGISSKVFFGRKVTEPQHHFSLTKFEILAIVETVKEFKRML